MISSSPPSLLSPLPLQLPSPLKLQLPYKNGDDYSYLHLNFYLDQQQQRYHYRRYQHLFHLRSTSTTIFSRFVVLVLVIVCLYCSLVAAAAFAKTTAAAAVAATTTNQPAATSILQNTAALKYYEAPDDCQLRIRGNIDNDNDNDNELMVRTSAATTARNSGGNSGEEVALVCNLRTINSETDRLNLSVIPSERTTSLKIKCSGESMSRSSLDERSFAHLSRLRQLILDYCKMVRWSATTLNGLRQLRNLTIRTRNIVWKDISLEVSPASFTQVKHLEWLDLSTNNIWSLPKNIFCPLINLIVLNVSGNHLQDIVELKFNEVQLTSSSEQQQQQRRRRRQNLTSATSKNASSAATVAMVIVNADESSMESPSCANNLNIRILDLSLNRFVLLPSNGLSGLKRLQRLYLHNNEISKVAEHSLAGLRNLKLIDLSGNKIVSLEWRNLFAECGDSVTEIYLQNNLISRLSAGLFVNLKRLESLDLSSNQLTSAWMNNETFCGLIRLISLNLSRNQITKLDASIFYDLYTLQILHFDHNGIETIPTDAFAALNNLHTLTLSYNRLKMLQMRSLNGLSALNTLNVDFNRIEYLDEKVLRNCCVAALSDLNLSGNKLKRVPTLALRGMRLLKTLDLGENSIESIETEDFDFNLSDSSSSSRNRTNTNESTASFATSSNLLYSLRLVGNSITTIRNGTFERLDSLQILNLSQNRIRTIEKGAFATNTKLEALRVDANELSNIDDAFVLARALLWLNVSDNRIRRFNYNSFPPMLVWLDMHGNTIEQLPKVASQSVNFSASSVALRLRTLDASFNRITRLESGSIPATIELLLLNNNRIRSIEGHAFANKMNLSRVDLYANNMARIELTALQLNPAVPDDRPLPQFFIGGNPFICDCTMAWLQGAKQLANKLRQHPTIMDMENIYCKLVYNRNERREYVALAETSISQFLCPYHSHCYTLCECCPFDACDCEMTCPSNCTCYRDSSWNTNIIECARTNQQTLPANIPMDATEIYLDGNTLHELASNAFIGRKNLLVLYANNSRIITLRNYTFRGLIKLYSLHLQQNRIEALHGNEFAGLELLHELYLQQNRIRFIDSRAFVHLKNVQILRLDGNVLNRFDVSHQFISNPYLVSIFISANPWSCDCQFVNELQAWIRRNYAKIIDLDTTHCTLHNDDAAGIITANRSYAYPLPLLELFTSNNDTSTSTTSCATFYGTGVLAAVTNHTHTATTATATATINSTVIVTAAAAATTTTDTIVNTFITILRENVAFLIACTTLIIIMVACIAVAFATISYIYFTRRKNGVQIPPRLRRSRFRHFNLFNYNGAGDESNAFDNNQQRRASASAAAAAAAADRERLFDVYITYSAKDERFVTGILCPSIEEQCCADGPPYRLCLHGRDFSGTGGSTAYGSHSHSHYVADTIIEAARSSKRTIVVVSQNFLLTEWLRYEYKLALQRVLQNERNKVIFVLLGDVTNLLDSHLRLYFKTNLCLLWGDAIFWKTLKSVMPNTKQISSTCSTASTFIVSSLSSLVASSSSSSSSFSSSSSSSSSSITVHNVTAAGNVYTTLANLQTVTTSNDHINKLDHRRSDLGYAQLPLSPLPLLLHQQEQQQQPPPLILTHNTRIGAATYYNTHTIREGEGVPSVDSLLQKYSWYPNRTTVNKINATDPLWEMSNEQ